MELYLVSTISLLALLLFLAKDNIYASLLLAAVGVAVALGAAAYKGPIAFILVSLVYVVASLTLVIVAAASIGDAPKTISVRITAPLALLLIPTVFLSVPKAGAAQPAGLDYVLIPLLAVFVIYALKIAIEMSI
ncbi:MAG: hypothetical protein ABWK05_07570 [Pyrobaculum sp.]